MGLLDKTNPHATPATATISALVFGVLGGGVGFMGWLLSDMSFAAVFFIVPWMILVGGITGWYFEWQMDSEDLEETQKEDIP